MLGIIGKKLGMTQIFNEQGQQIPCTVVEAKPNPVVQVLENEIDKLLGKPWDDELETFRHAGEGAPVRWLHQVV